MINSKDDFAMNARTTTFVVLCAAFFFLAGRAVAEEVVLDAEVDKARISADAIFSYKLTISSSLSRIPKPKFPDFSGFKVLSRTNTSQITIAQGKTRTTLAYIFVLAPTAAGVFTISPAELKIGDKTYSSAELKIEVEPSKLKPGNIPEPHPEIPADDSLQPEVTL